MDENKFASRAGLKLEHALREFNVDVKDKICADLGCSTGGFTDCLLQNGAKKVYAIDTAYGELAWKLRNDPRVIVMERTNALYTDLPEKVDFISVDVGWTQQKLIIPKSLEFLKDDGIIISLVKPQYEAENIWRKKGKVKDEFLENTLEKVKNDLANLPIEIKGITESPLKGEKGGNTEYLMLISKTKNID
ncbi:MAG: TlyA family RNA methyltransferase [Patescibacteria group bacterium]|nr:TlyA family RNA methyltransferase [Patescibacteria group bacterium]